ncbi:HpaII family restriction endonuclease [Lederbergia sp. NSJ-179]|uniref:HpaII family restriction endonuclease n=1 Tax=Lederbergia sp. NSJ-179 TaxID=2931402 RepID=UPI001FD14B79|nr:HpaII family restriction endonuclease [Lederbergia sp. NSJ-179]MCJ7842641.1 HpaII family restriction endonuclease [Lederbergia sp. NSJ-179]
MTKRYNKGEWSEFYAFLEILSTGKLYAADENMNKIATVYYTILSAVKNDIEYNRIDTGGIITFEHEGKVTNISIEDFKNMSHQLFQVIKSSNATFSVPEIEPFIEKLHLTTIKERSDSKGDIKLKIHDNFTGFEPTLSFSIKSYVGSNPTLLNASRGTILRYKLTGNLSDSEINDINNIEGKGKVIKRIEEIRSKGLNLIYKDIPATIFKENLQMIDYRLPEIISEIFLESYFVRGKRISEVVQSYLEKNPHENDRIIKYKVREFLVAIALGMVPLTEWSGLDEANGGYIVVKDTAEVLCYHVYERNRLKEYLYTHTKFDTPSTGRTNAGQLLTDANGEIVFNLTMQIRF